MRPKTFFLEPVTPFRLDLTVWTLRRRPENIVDRWDGQTYRRVLILQNGLAEIGVIQVGPCEAPRLQVSVEGQPLLSSVKAAVTLALERLLGLRIDLTKFYQLAAREKQLGQLAHRFQGMKPPRYETIFESAIVGIASQQVSRTASIIVLNRLTEGYGAKLRDEGKMTHAFPRPEDLAGLSPAALRLLGFSGQKERAMIEIAQSIVGERLNLEELAALSDEDAVERLGRLRGIGRWTAEYILLRGFGRTHIFPGDDVGARSNLKRWLGLEKPLDYDAVRRILARWHPFAGLIYFHMLLDRLEQSGFLQAEPSKSRAAPSAPIEKRQDINRRSYR